MSMKTDRRFCCNLCPAAAPEEDGLPENWVALVWVKGRMFIDAEEPYIRGNHVCARCAELITGDSPRFQIKGVGN